MQSKRNSWWPSERPPSTQSKQSTRILLCPHTQNTQPYIWPPKNNSLFLIRFGASFFLCSVLGQIEWEQKGWSDTTTEKKKKNLWWAWPKTWRMRPLQHVYYPQAHMLPGTLLKRRMRQINEAPKLNGITLWISLQLRHCLNSSQRTITFFFPSSRVLAAIGQRHSPGLWKSDLSLLTAAHCTAEPIKLKVQLDIAFMPAVDKRQGAGKGVLEGKRPMCAWWIDWDGCRVLHEAEKDRNPKKGRPSRVLGHCFCRAEEVH